MVFVGVERTAKNPVVPFDLFLDRDRLATFAAMFLTRGVGFTLTVLVAMYVQNIMSYSALRAGISFIPFAIAMTVGVVVSSRVVARFSTRVVVIVGSTWSQARSSTAPGRWGPASPTSRTLRCPSSSALPASA